MGQGRNTTIVLLTLFILLSGLSFYHVDKSILVVKYLFQYNIQYLPQNYFRYHHSLTDFISQTCIFHSGNSEAGWKTILFLWPLFLFCDALGGLTLTHICLFTVTTTLLTLILFYAWVRKYWGQQPAFWGTFFFGFSAIFQELARSGSYDAYSILIAMLWTILFYHCAGKAGVFAYAILGFFTGLSWYGYAMIRTLVVAVFVEIYYFARRRWLSGAFFIMGMLLWIVPGVVILMNLLQQYGFHGHLDVLFIDKENVVSVVQGDVLSLLGMILHNVMIFIQRMLGFNDYLDWPCGNQLHAHFLNHLLVIPMLVGLLHVFRSRQQLPGRLLLWLGAMIYVTPLCTSDWANAEGRRFLFYVLPTYCFIGIGMGQIITWRKFRPLMILGICFVLISEALFTHQYIINGRRELGLADFADKLNERHEQATIIYLEKRQDSLYFFSNEGYLFNLLLQKNGQHFYTIKEALLDLPLKEEQGKCYLAISPMISNKEFLRWCQSNKLKLPQPVLQSAVKNPLLTYYRRTLVIQEPFKLYDISSRPN